MTAQTRPAPAGFTLGIVIAVNDRAARWWLPAPLDLGWRRTVAAFATAAVGLPALTALLVTVRPDLALVDEVLCYLLAVIAVSVIGGFWPAVLTAVAAALLLNWYFTPPVHTLTIDAPENILALLLFVAAAIAVSSVVHLAARRTALAARRAAEAAALLDLARTVLAGEDSPQAILAHLATTLHRGAELQERVGADWARIAVHSVAEAADSTPIVPSGRNPRLIVPAGPDLRLVVYGDCSRISRRVLDGFAAQAAAALDRQRLRIQAGQAESLAEANRIRTALLAAVSHDLRTPLASVKAAVSTLRQTDIAWSAEDQAALLATIEDGADRLDTLIGNLLDMSRVHTGTLQPFIRPTAVEEVAPLAMRGLDGGHRLRLDIPDTLPLLAADPGLLERALANLIGNALRYSPPDKPPTLTAHADGDTIAIRVIDHGPGIPPEERGHAFEPFQQLGDRHTGGGVGLGLAVAKGFVEALGGDITATATPGGGLTMTLRLPVADHRAGAPA